MNKALSFAIIAVVFAGAGFIGGMQYQKSKGSVGLNRQTGFGNFPNLTQEQRDQMRQQFGAFGSQRGMRSGDGFAGGEIISKDDKSITIKMRDGGSKIIFYSSTTEVGKFINGTASDLEVGLSVTVTGTANQDGSITAQSIQLRPQIVNQP